MLKHEREPL